MQNAFVTDFENSQLKGQVVDFDVGDTLKVSTKIIEGEKERTQVFQGTCISRKGIDASATFSLHRISYGVGMERVFYLHSPRITNIEVVKRGDVRRAKLYYLRGASGKAAKVQERLGGASKKEQGKSESPAVNEGSSEA